MFRDMSTRLAIALAASFAFATVARAQSEARIEAPAPPAVEVQLGVEVAPAIPPTRPAPARARCERVEDCPSALFSASMGTSITVFEGDFLPARTFRLSAGFSPLLQFELMIAAGMFWFSERRADVADIMLGLALRSEFADIDRVVRFYAVAGVALMGQSLISNEDEPNGTAVFYAGLGTMFGWPTENSGRHGFYIEARGQYRLATPYSAAEPALEIGMGVVAMTL
jgi:hypothetical protein